MIKSIDKKVHRLYQDKPIKKTRVQKYTIWFTRLPTNQVIFSHLMLKTVKRERVDFKVQRLKINRNYTKAKMDQDLRIIIN